MIIDANLSTHQYNIIREQGNSIVRNMYPSYHTVKQTREQCYPTDISGTETVVDIKLQSLIDHTIQRLCITQKDGFETFQNAEDLTFLMKWGCDGAQQSRYKQKFSSEDESDASLFSFSLVPIQLYGQINDLKKILWQNPAPSSSRYCRPIKLIFAKESADFILTEVKSIEAQVQSLVATTVEIGGFSVNPSLILTMIDGKICSALSEFTSSQSCFTCGATPKIMNNPILIANRQVDEKTLTFGLSPLHSWIRFMECVLHISYRLPVKVWQVKGPELKRIVGDRKNIIQDKLKMEMGLLVDMPNQSSGIQMMAIPLEGFLEMQSLLQK